MFRAKIYLQKSYFRVEWRQTKPFHFHSIRHDFGALSTLYVFAWFFSVFAKWHGFSGTPTVILSRERKKKRMIVSRCKPMHFVFFSSMSTRIILSTVYFGWFRCSVHKAKSHPKVIFNAENECLLIL